MLYRSSILGHLMRRRPSVSHITRWFVRRRYCFSPKAQIITRQPRIHKLSVVFLLSTGNGSWSTVLDGFIVYLRKKKHLLLLMLSITRLRIAEANTALSSTNPSVFRIPHLAVKCRPLRKAMTSVLCSRSDYRLKYTVTPCVLVSSAGNASIPNVCNAGLISRLIECPHSRAHARTVDHRTCNGVPKPYPRPPQCGFDHSPHESDTLQAWYLTQAPCLR